MQKDIGNHIVHSDGKVWSKAWNRFMNPAIKAGYNSLVINGKTKRIHRIVAEAFLPNPNNLPEINHKSGVKTDNRVENLEWCTRLENVKHAIQSGLTKIKGEDNCYSKLTNMQVLEIRKSKGIYQKELAGKYGISQSVISKIRNNKNWKHI
jgi:hypothetical protein